MGEERVLHSDKVEKDACVKQSPVTSICEEINRDCIDETISHYLLVVFNKAVYSESFWKTSQLFIKVGWFDVDNLSFI